jgi:pilus assembly protein CpaB
MQNKANIWAIFAFSVGFIGHELYLNHLKNEIRGGAEESVLIATADVEAGKPVQDEHLATVRIPGDYVADRRVRAEEQNQVVGVSLAHPLRVGQGLFWTDLADGQARRHLARLVKPGYRAYALPKNANPLRGLVRVGDRVDVLVRRGDEASTLLEHVLVLAVGDRISADEAQPEGSRSTRGGVTLSVTPVQAEELQEAERGGELRLALRNPADTRLRAIRPGGGLAIGRVPMGPDSKEREGEKNGH